MNREARAFIGSMAADFDDCVVWYVRIFVGDLIITDRRRYKKPGSAIRRAHQIAGWFPLVLPDKHITVDER